MDCNRGIYKPHEAAVPLLHGFEALTRCEAALDEARRCGLWTNFRDQDGDDSARNALRDIRASVARLLPRVEALVHCAASAREGGKIGRYNRARAVLSVGRAKR